MEEGAEPRTLSYLSRKSAKAKLPQSRVGSVSVAKSHTNEKSDNFIATPECISQSEKGILLATFPAELPQQIKPKIKENKRENFLQVPQSKELFRGLTNPRVFLYQRPLSPEEIQELN